MPLRRELDALQGGWPSLTGSSLARVGQGFFRLPHLEITSVNAWTILVRRTGVMVNEPVSSATGDVATPTTNIGPRGPTRKPGQFG